MNYCKIFCIIYSVSIFCIDREINNFDQETISDIFIPFEIEISLDFLEMQIDKNQDILRNDWNSIESQNIIKNAESIVKNSPQDFTEKIKTKIIGFFKEINIKIAFTDDDMIIKDDITNLSKISFLDKISEEENEQKLIQERIIAQQKYKELHPDTTQHKHTKPHRIHGARRTMNRLKKRDAQQAKKEKEHHKDLIEAIHNHLEKRAQKAKNAAQKKVDKTPKVSNSANSSRNEKNDERNEQEDRPDRPINISRPSNAKNIKSRFTKPQTAKIHTPFEHEEKPHSFTIDPILN